MRGIWIGLLGLMLLASACSGDSTAEQTMVAQSQVLGTQMADIRSTATVVADRLQLTAVSAETFIAQAQQQNQRLAATISALGGSAGSVQPQAPVPTQPGPGPESTVDLAAPVPPVTPAATADAASGPTLYNVVTARQVGANDCAVASVNSFTAADTQIYVVATAANITPGTTLASRWFRDGTEVIMHDFTPDFAIQESCVWFFIDPSETPFTAGAWSVQLEINGAAVGEPVTFSISG